MNYREGLNRRQRFEQSLRRSGWDESSITTEWYKVEAENQAFEIYRDNNPDYQGYIKAMEFLDMLRLREYYDS